MRRQMNPRQRQGLLLVVVAAAGLIGVFLLVAGYVSSVSKQVGPKVEVLTLLRPLPAYQQVTSADLGFVELPERWVPGTALRDPSQALDQISQVPLPKGTELEQGMLTNQPALRPGEQEFGLPVDATTGVAGQVQAGSVVNIVATFSGGQSRPASARVIVSDVSVLIAAQATGGSSGGGVVTLALTPQQVQQVAYVESFAQKYWLSLVAPGTTGTQPQLPPYEPGL
ncbi:MAG TPA: Flp pilus assembly protein CpaB [Solirubrobacteraceae bacterium]|nr:Flp pilus assembly protein CpaB [Solirubrobacteraceae bacterium]